MCCTEKGSRVFTRAIGCECGCNGSFRRFITAKEEQEILENYIEQLNNEIIGAKERIQELKK